MWTLMFYACTAPPADPLAGAAAVTVGDAKVEALLDPDPPQAGDETLTLRITRAGVPVTGESLDVVSVMPEMGAMPEMREKAALTEVGGGLYRGPFRVSMGGGWTLHVTLDTPVQGKALFSFTTDAKGLVTGEEGPTGHDDTFPLSAVRRQLWGIRTETVEQKPLVREVHALGRVAWDETKQVDVVAQAPGYVRNLAAGETGQPIRKGARLFDLESAELQAAQRDWLVARDAGVPGLLDAAAARLRLLGFPDVDGLARRGQPLDRVPILAPAEGAVVEKMVVEGAAVEMGMKLFRIAPLDPVWVQVALWPEDVPDVAMGAEAHITVADRPDVQVTGRVEHLHPEVEMEHRTRDVRIAVDNPHHQLLPGMQVDVGVSLDLGRGLVVPESAVLWTGPRRIVFVDRGDGRLEPRELQLGEHVDEGWAVLAGLKEGDVVVTSGTFLVASESRLRSATGFWDAR